MTTELEKSLLLEGELAEKSYENKNYNVSYAHIQKPHSRSLLQIHFRNSICFVNCFLAISF